MENLQDERKCKLCLDNDINLVFLNCGHLFVCNHCAIFCTVCPICRTKVDKFVKTYFS